VIATPAVRLLRRHEIDERRYDDCVLTDPRPLPYGITWWLDIVTDHNWEVLVADDYRCVLPLPRVRRAGLLPTYLRPPFTQQLGPFGAVEPAVVHSLLSHIPRKAQIALPLRGNLGAGSIPPRFATRPRVNLVLDLDRPFTELATGFPKKLQAYLKKCTADRLEPIPTESLVQVCRQELERHAGLTESNFLTLLQLVDETTRRKFGAAFQLREQGELLAVGFYPELAGRTINLIAASTDRGRKRRGMARLLSLVMAGRSNRPGAVFDFEGSELPGVRRFFEKFGTRNEDYLLIEERGYGFLT
jgi:hypothetical protein